MSLENVKVGDWIKVQVTEVDLDKNFPIRCGEDLNFTLGGEYKLGRGQIAFPLEPTERWMMVSADQISWYKRKVVMTKKGRFFTWDNAETEDEINNSFRLVGWGFAKEIEPKIEFNLELSLEEIAEKFGVNVEQIKIKK